MRNFDLEQLTKCFMDGQSAHPETALQLVAMVKILAAGLRIIESGEHGLSVCMMTARDSLRQAGLK